MTSRILPALLLFTGLSPATVLDIPYPGGKRSGSFTVTVDNGKAISPDTIRIGAALTFRVYFQILPLAVCSNRGELGIQVFATGGGITMRRPSHDTDWIAYPSPHSLSSNVLADSVPTLSPSDPSAPSKAQGWIIARPGDLDCMTDTYSLDSNYRQLLFPVGGGYYSKIQVASFTETVPGPPPPLYQPRVLNTVTVRYIINEEPDLSGPAPIRPARPEPASRFGARLEQELYNPLGIKLRRDPGRFEPTLPGPAKP